MFLQSIKKGNNYSISSRSLESLLQLIISTEPLGHLNLLTGNIQDFFLNDERIDKTISLCESWAKGDIKMLRAKKAILEVHAMAKETPNPIVIAKLHAIGQGLYVMHGLLFYN